MLKTALFTLLVPLSVTVWVPFFWLFPGTRAHTVAPPWRWLAGLVMAAGAAGYFWCAWNFAVTGRGTPAIFDAPKVFVARGPYQFVRNPMYVSVLAVLFGECLLFGSVESLRYAAVVALGFHLFVVFYEEPGLRRKFGAPYETYCAKVRRWLPRVSPKRESDAV